MIPSTWPVDDKVDGRVDRGIEPHDTHELEWLSFALEQAGVVAWEWNPASDELCCSQNAAALLGLSPAALPSTSQELLARIHPGDRPRVQRALQRARDPNSPCREEVRVVRPDGQARQVRWLECKARAVRARQGTRVRGVLVDISEQYCAQGRVQDALRHTQDALRHTQDALNESCSFLRMAERASGVSTFDWDLPSGNATCSELYFEIFGVPPGDFTSTYEQWAARVHPEDRERMLAHMPRAVAGTEPCRAEYRIVRPDGQVRWVHYAGKFLRDDHGQPVRMIGTMADITARKQAEEALAASEREFRAFFELVSVGAAEADPATGRFTRVNQRLCDITGYSEAELLERTFLDLTHPDDRQRDAEMYQAVLQGASLEWKSEKRYVRRDGAIVWVLVSGRLIRDRDGRPLRSVATILDITDRKRAEDALKEADQRKDEFLATLAHELRNPLAPIRNALQLMGVPSLPEDRRAWAREVIDRQSQQLTRLVEDLLDVSRITRGKVELRTGRIELAPVLEQAVEVSRPLIEASGHELRIHLPAEPVWIDADAARVAQIVANLLNNAAKYTMDHGTIRLGAGMEGGEVVIRVRDTGVGIAPDMLSQVFEMFAQVDSSQERAQGGLGIGLTLVKSLVEMHGGTIEAHSDGLGQGSEFVVRLPAAKEME